MIHPKRETQLTLLTRLPGCGRSEPEALAALEAAARVEEFPPREILDSLTAGDVFDPGTPGLPAACSASTCEPTRCVLVPQSVVARHRGALRPGPVTVYRSELALFIRRVGNLVKGPPVSCGPEASVAEAARLMTGRGVGSVIVVGGGGAPLGIITDRDLRIKVVAQGLASDSPVSAIMSSPLLSMDPARPAFDGLLEMTRRGIHHMGVVSGGRLEGVVSSHDIIMLQGTHPVGLVRDIEGQGTLDGLAEVAPRVQGVVKWLAEAGAGAFDIGRIVAELNDRLVRRALELVQAGIEAQGHGRPPLPFAWLAAGSEGRREQTLKTDQDNGLLYADPPPALREAAADYFARLAGSMGEALSRLGFPPCPGGFMASNPRWCQPDSAWRRYFTGWMETPEPEQVLHASLFFDLRPIAGDEEVGRALWEWVCEQAPSQRLFLGYMAKAALERHVPLGFFGGFVVERSGTHKDTLDLKARGVFPVTQAMRVCALSLGLHETNIPTVAAGGVLFALHRRGVLADPYAVIVTVLVGFSAMMTYLGVMAHSLGRSLVRTRQEIQRGTELMATVNPDYRHQVRTGDEMESVAEEINRMADRVRDARVGLEAEVALATRDPHLLTESDRRELLQFAERTLSGAVGTASAQAIIEGLGQANTGGFEAIFDVFGRVSQSLEQSREDLQRRVRELSLLNEATRRIASTLDPPQMMDGVVELLTREFEFDLLTVRLCDSDGRLRITSQSGLPPGTDLSRGDPVSRETYFGECFLDNRVIVVEDAIRMHKPLVLPTHSVSEPRSFVHAPIAIEERPIGILSAYSSTGHVYFSPEFLQFFRTLAVQLGLGLHNAQLYRELGDLSRAREEKVAQRTAQLEEANRRLQELDRLKSDFVSTVSHELRTPLTSIRSLSESLLAARDMSRDRQEQLLAIITQESQRLSRMINQLLDLSRIEAGKMEWRLENLELREVVTHAVQANRSLFDEKGIAVVVATALGRPQVLADRDKIIQVLTNLLSNAAKFTPAGGRVEVRVFREDARAVVEVEDTGIGILPDQIETIFDKFRQVGDTLTAKPEGAGLGLPISREIVLAHGGSLTARSAPSQGSCFRMTLPFAS